MSKLYVFGIGGTGSRVLKSLTMLLASGVKCKDTIVPIIIDRDIANGDLERTRDIVKDYMRVNTEVAGKNLFFNTKMELLDDKLVLQLNDETTRFSKYIGYDHMSDENKALTSVLFSEDTLKMNMAVGFQGNPNVGSVVLNQFENAGVFDEFVSKFGPEDKIFVVSSIFGGTGASGFPLLLKTLRRLETNQQEGKWDNIRNASFGAITVLPYFDVKKDTTGESLVKSSTFIDKTKAALSYYKSLDKQLDALYYIADKERSSYEHCSGGKNQENKANFIELASALAIIDFSNTATPHRDKDNKAIIKKTTYKEFGIVPRKGNNAKEISFADMNETNKIIRQPLIQFFLFRKYLQDVFDKECKYQPYARDRFNSAFLSRETIKPLITMQDKFYNWLKEMIWLEEDKTKQDRSFAPLKLQSSKDDVFDFISAKNNAKKGKGWAWMDDELNRLSGKGLKSETIESQFIELFYRATENFVKKIVDHT